MAKNKNCGRCGLIGLRRIIIACIAFFTVGMASADNYNSLWKRVAAAQQKDQPRSAIEVLDRIVSRARSQQDFGQLLKAGTMRIELRAGIAPDSLAVDLSRLRTQERHLRQRNLPLAAVYQSILGSAIARLSRVEEAWEDSLPVARDYLLMSVGNKQALSSTKTSGYEPLLEEGIDSRYFGDDLLHVLAMQASVCLADSDAKKMLDEVADFYEAQDNRTAACYMHLIALMTNRQSGSYVIKRSLYVNQLDKLLKRYEDLPVACEVAIQRYNCMAADDAVKNERKMNFLTYAISHWGDWPRANVLRNLQSRLTLPSFQVMFPNSLIAPGKESQAVLLGVTNVGNVSMTIRRLNISGDTSLNPNDKDDLQKLLRSVDESFAPLTVSKDFIGLPPYQVSRDTISVPALPVGVYLVSFTTDNRSIDTENCLLHVSGIRLLMQGLPGKKHRIVALDAMSGKPLPKVKLRLKPARNGGKEVNLTTDSKGEAIYADGGNRSYTIFAYTDSDRAGLESYTNTTYAFYDAQTRYSNLAYIFTDRSIYRPGQTVHVAALVFKDNDHGTAVVQAGQKLTLRLRDANYKTIAKTEATTDEWGMASADFTLPSAGSLTGRFSVASESGSAWFQVEEYKRPTFEVKFDKMTSKYQDGDSVTLTGRALTYSGMPVQNAKVAYEVNRRPMWWWHWTGNYGNSLVDKDTVKTDSEGRFAIKTLMELPETDNPRLRQYFNFTFTATVTDLAGESHEAETSLPLSNHPAQLTSDLPKQIESEKLSQLTFIYRNNAGENIPGQVCYQVDGKPMGTVKANTAIDFRGTKLHSGEHTLLAVCGTDTLEQKFVTFSVKDNKAPYKTHDWFYLSSNDFPLDGSPVYLQAGSSDDYQHVVYSIMTGSKVLESGSAELKGKLFTRKFTYKEEYADGLRLVFGWVKDGEVYTHSETIRRPVKSRKMTLSWKTFRDRLVPGQQEEWTLTILDPDGKPAKASLAAVLYDKSLDQLYPHTWDLSLGYNYRIPFSTFVTADGNFVSLYGEQRWQAQKERALDFTHFYRQAFFIPNTPLRYMIRGLRLARANGYGEVLMAKAEPMMVADQAVQTEAIRKSSPTRSADQAKKTGDSGSLRQNLAETAFFFPSLVSNGKGEVSLKFTLPESVTTWRFMGMAHDKVLNYGLCDTTAVAKKKVMAQPNMPRFLRKGDSGVLQLRISNTSDQRQQGTARLELINPETGKTLLRQEQRFSVEKGKTAVADFNVEAKTDWPELLIARVQAEGNGFSDGEQHYLPILSQEEMAMNTLTFTMNRPGEQTFSLEKLLPRGSKDQRLTLEYTNNPAWLMVQSLPLVGKTSENNAVSQAVAYYANSIGRYLMGQRPDIRQTIDEWKKEQGKETSMMSQLSKNQELKTLLLDETPWLLDARQEEEQKQQLSDFFDETAMDARLNANLTRIRNLQNPDGSFSWWPGMRGSAWMTMTVTETLVRLNKLCGEQQDTKSILSRAFKYLDKEIAEEVVKLKELHSKHVKELLPSDFALHYLYASVLSGRAKQPTSDMKYFVALMAKQNSVYSIYGKANSAIILSAFGEQAKAKELLKSISEYTVYKEDMGRYFDTPKATYSWQSYRIPQQVAAIEAWKELRPADKETINQMQRWLLQEKRTQQWDTPINTANAIYAFLNGEMDRLNTTGSMAEFRLDGQTLQLPKATAGLGYVKLPVDKTSARQLQVSKTSEGTSWGAVYAQFRQKATDIVAASTGLTVKREVKAKTALKKGDRVVVRLTITADRDYDFVQVVDKRAACLEPVSQLSGYRMGCYIAPKDNATCFYFDRMAKGTHVVEFEYYLDRSGNYQSGTATAQCAYSPEFYGRATAGTLTVGK